MIRESCKARTKTPIINSNIANKGLSPSGALNMKNLGAVEAIVSNPKFKCFIQTTFKKDVKLHKSVAKFEKLTNRKKMQQNITNQ